MFGNLFQVIFWFNHSLALGPGATLLPPPQVFSVPINNVKKGRRVSSEGPTTPTCTWLWLGNQHGESLKDQ